MQRSLQETKNFLKVLEATRFYKPYNSFNLRDRFGVQLNFNDDQELSFFDCSTLYILEFKGMSDKNRPGACFVRNHQRVAKDPIRNDYPPDFTTGTNIFSVNTNIIEQQHVARVKSPLLRTLDSEKRLSNGTFQVASTTAPKMFSERQFKKPLTSTIEEIQIEIVSVTEQKVSCTGT